MVDISKVKEAALQWEHAGIAKRLQVLQEAGKKLLEYKSDLQNVFVLEGLSLDLAEEYSKFILQAGNPELLEKYSANILSRHKAGYGEELLVYRPDGIVLLFAQAGSPTFNAATLFSILLPGNGAIVTLSAKIDFGVRFIVEKILHPVFKQYGFSKELVLIVTENYRKTLPILISTPEVKTILSIGSATDNATIAAEAYKYKKKIILEHYGRGCITVWKDAPIQKVVKSAIRAFEFSSKPCFLPKQIFVHQEVFKDFLSSILELLPLYSKTIEADHKHGNLCQIGQIDEYLLALKEAQEVGQVHSGGYCINADGQVNEKGNYIYPTIVTLDSETCLSRSLSCIDKEIFYPLLPIVEVRGNDEEIMSKMCKLIEREPVRLRTSIWASKPEIICSFAQEIGATSLLRFNQDHSECPMYASFWVTNTGDNNMIWQQTSHLQAIDCSQLTKQQIQFLLNSLGYIS